jgi:hypothetical protein
LFFFEKNGRVSKNKKELKKQKLRTQKTNYLKFLRTHSKNIKILKICEPTYPFGVFSPASTPEKAPFSREMSEKVAGWPIAILKKNGP